MSRPRSPAHTRTDGLATARIRKAIPLHASGPVIAVKFINNAHAFRTGRLKPQQLQLECSLHKLVCPHDNIIRFIDCGASEHWTWMCLELAEGGDLFDKIEADEGVPPDIAHLYFTQLCAAVAWCHDRGVAHRDIKPENMLLSAAGALKLADFGLATFFRDPKTGAHKRPSLVCGSPPYIAPEILAVGRAYAARKRGSDAAATAAAADGYDPAGYDPPAADTWSCAIVLFVLLAGNTPWDTPVRHESYEYYEFIATHGHPADDLWAKVPPDALSLLRGMLAPEVARRFAMPAVRAHPWFTRRNPLLDAHGRPADPLALATQLMQSLRIDLAAAVPDPDPSSRLAATQPEPALPLDWEPPQAAGASLAGHAASQPALTTPLLVADLLAHDPSLSQFTPTPSLPLTLTQHARRFTDIVPAHSLARFLSTQPLPQLVAQLVAALHRLSVPVAAPAQGDAYAASPRVVLRVRTLDTRRQPLHGAVVVEGLAGTAQGVLEVRFHKEKGDPLGWRRLFKQVAVLCRDGLVVPTEG